MKRILGAVLGVLALYVASYLAVRAANVDVWARDGRPYVIIPVSARWLYYFYRPIMYLDAVITGMGFHIGPHRDLVPATPHADVEATPSDLLRQPVVERSSQSFKPRRWIVSPTSHKWPGALLLKQQRPNKALKLTKHSYNRDRRGSFAA